MVFFQGVQSGIERRHDVIAREGEDVAHAGLGDRLHQRALEINSTHHELVGGIGKGDAKLVEWRRSQLINITIIAATMHNTPESINA